MILRKKSQGHAVFISVPAKITAVGPLSRGAIRYNIYEKKALAIHSQKRDIWHANCL
jgi:hypothetical protein